LRMTVVRSDTKCAALLPRAGRYPIAPSSSSSSSSWRHAHAHGLRGLLNLGGASSSSGPGAPGAAWTGQGGGGGGGYTGAGAAGGRRCRRRSCFEGRRADLDLFGGGLDWIFGFPFFQRRRGVCPRRLAGSDAV
jgi:hypothetical protein